ncbi:hypothetical protein TNCV_3626621 [Trichonephila clavipes]|nr:hypothetical protein TNCV_3626621 [Trichonephila clavipes]
MPSGKSGYVWTRQEFQERSAEWNRFAARLELRPWPELVAQGLLSETRGRRVLSSSVHRVKDLMHVKSVLASSLFVGVV